MLTATKTETTAIRMWRYRLTGPGFRAVLYISSGITRHSGTNLQPENKTFSKLTYSDVGSFHRTA